MFMTYPIINKRGPIDISVILVATVQIYMLPNVERYGDCECRTGRRVEADAHSLLTRYLLTIPKRNDYQKYFLGGKGGRCVGLTTLPPSCADCLEI